MPRPVSSPHSPASYVHAAFGSDRRFGGGDPRLAAAARAWPATVYKGALRRLGGPAPPRPRAPRPVDACLFDRIVVVGGPPPASGPAASLPDAPSPIARPAWVRSRGPGKAAASTTTRSRPRPAAPPSRCCSLWHAHRRSRRRRSSGALLYRALAGAAEVVAAGVRRALEDRLRPAVRGGQSPRARRGRRPAGVARAGGDSRALRRAARGGRGPGGGGHLQIPRASCCGT